MASIVDELRPGQEVCRRIFVPVFTVEDALSKIPTASIAIIKIDVEGAEEEILESFRDILRNQRPFVVAKFSPSIRKTIPNASNDSRGLRKF